MILLAICMIIMVIDIISLHLQIEDLEKTIDNIYCVPLDDLINYKEWEKHKEDE